MGTPITETKQAAALTAGVPIFFAVLMIMLVVVMGPLFALERFIFVEIPTARGTEPLHALIGLFFALASAMLVSRGITNKLNRLSTLANLAARARTTGDVTRCEREIRSLGGSKEIREIGREVAKVMRAIKAPSLEHAQARAEVHTPEQ